MASMSTKTFVLVVLAYLSLVIGLHCNFKLSQSFKRQLSKVSSPQKKIRPQSTFLSSIKLQSDVVDLYSTNFQGPSPIWHAPEMISHAMKLIHSYYKLTGKDLVPKELFEKDSFFAAQKLFFDVDRAVVSHGTQSQPNGPTLNYGNTAALACFEASWEDLTTLPSRYTADIADRTSREEAMKLVTEFGIVTGYNGVRKSLSGKLFAINDTTIWNIELDGVYYGQAATFLRR